MTKEVRDLYLAALLKLRGHRPVGVHADGRRAVWDFIETRDLQEDLAAYFAGTLEVSALDYQAAIRDAKGAAMNLSEARA